MLKQKKTIDELESENETMQVKREQGTSEAAHARGNVSNNPLSDTIDLDPSSPTHITTNLDDIPLSRVYRNLDKALPPSPTTKTSKKLDDVDDSKQSTIDERTSMML